MDQISLQQKNPDKQIESVTDVSFLEYGQVINETKLEHAGLSNLTAYAREQISFPIEESEYRASEAGFESWSVIRWIETHIYGGMQIQAGRCVGHNQVLNGVEYHQGSETIIALSDLVLILGKRSDMIDYHYDLSKARFFYMREGSCVELYGTTLHYTPCQVEETGFATICILPKGTNTAIEENDCEILTKKNKFFITHPTMTAKIAQGAKPYLTGDIVGIVI